MPTYGVVPLSPSLGMLEFVGGTVPLLALLSPDMLDTKPADAKYLSFISVRKVDLCVSGLAFLDIWHTGTPVITRTSKAHESYA